MIVHAYYEEDPRVRREAESLVGQRTTGPRPRAAPPRAACGGVLQASTCGGSRCSATRAPGSGRTARVPVVPGALRVGGGQAPSPPPVRAGAGRTRCRTSSCSPPCPCASSASRCCSTCTRRCPSSSSPASRAPPTRCPIAPAPPGAPVDRVRDARAHGQRGDAETAASASGRDDKLSIVINSPSLERFDERPTRAAPSARTARCG